MKDNNFYSSNPKDHNKTFETWDELFEFQAKKDGANYNMLKDWLKNFCDVPKLKDESFEQHSDKKMHMNTLISIGYIGLKHCFLNITQEEAIKRYCKTEDISRQDFDDNDIIIDTIYFDDEFSAYEIWEL